MDYLWEVERRQSAALTRLLTGTRSPKETEAEQHRETERSETGRAETARPAEGASVMTEAEQALPSGRQQTETASAAVERAALAEQAEVFYRTRQADALWRDVSTSSGSLPGLLMPTYGGGAEAEDLSRAIQRDARRYDGGFRIY